MFDKFIWNHSVDTALNQREFKKFLIVKEALFIRNKNRSKMQDTTNNSTSFNACDKGTCSFVFFFFFVSTARALYFHLSIFFFNESIWFAFTDNLTGSHLNDSGIDSSSYNSSIINGNGTDNKEKQPLIQNNRSMSSNDKYEAKKSIFILIGIFSVSLCAMFYVYLMFPKLNE